MADASNAPAEPPPAVAAAGKKGRPPSAAKKSPKPQGDAPPPPAKKPSPKAARPPKAKAQPAAVEAKKRLTAAEKKKLAAAAAAASGSDPAPPQPNATQAAMPPELSPLQDAELRRSSLHQIYLQVAATHRGQNDQLLRQFATKLEMDVCRTASTRSEYISGINYELTKLMQAELASKGDASASSAPPTTAGAAFSSYQGAPPSEPPAAAASSSEAKPSAGALNASQQQVYMPAAHSSQAAPTAQTQSSAPSGTSSMSEGSFMQSLMAEQSSSGAYTHSGSRGQLPNAAMYTAGNSLQQQQQSGGGNGAPGASQGHPNSTHGYDQHSQSQGRIPVSATSPVMTFQEFVVQVQRFDRDALVELMWNQRNTLLQWQRRVQQLEAQLSARYSFGSSGASSPYYSGTPPGAPMYGANVSATLSSEAEMARASMRRNDRMGAQQQQQPPYAQQPQYAAAQAGRSPMTGGSPSAQASGAVVNPALYWEKVRMLKDAHAQHLYIAHRALSQHSAPASSAQGIKAENVKHNITITMNVLSEPPKSVQPRSFEVLHSIERFIQNTILPIVQKVQEQSGGQTPQQSNTTTPAAAAGLPGYASSSASPSVSAGYSTGSADAPQFTSNTGSARLYAPSPGANAASQVQAGGAVSPADTVDDSAPATAAASGESAGVAAANKPSASSAKGKKVKSEAVGGAPKVPPRAKQPVAVDGKAPPKRLSKAEAKLAVQQQQQQQQQALLQQSQQPSAQAAAAAAAESAAAVADGHQSPFGTGASSFDKLSTPTVSPSENRAMVSAEDTSVKTLALDAASKSVAPPDVVGDNAEEEDDALNDFSDFPELDFDEEMPSMKIQFNKENSSAFNAKKRAIGDV